MEVNPFSNPEDNYFYLVFNPKLKITKRRGCLNPGPEQRFSHRPAGTDHMNFYEFVVFGNVMFIKNFLGLKTEEASESYCVKFSSGATF